MIFQWYNSSTYILGVTNSYIIICIWTSNLSWYCNHSQLPVLAEVIDSRGEATAIIFLNQYSF